MRSLSRSSDYPPDPTDNADVVPIMKGRRAINPYMSQTDDLDWSEHDLGRQRVVHEFDCDSDVQQAVRSHRGPMGSNNS